MEQRDYASTAGLAEMTTVSSVVSGCFGVLKSSVDEFPNIPRRHGSR
jgi:hypothetical protein